MIRSPNHMERKIYPVTPRSGDRDGCIHIGLGSGMQWSTDRWPVVPGKTMGIQQWTGADGRHIPYASCSKGQAKRSYSPQDGQHTVLILCDQDGEHTVYHTYRSGLPVVGLVATSLNYQLDKYVSWRPDPGAMMISVFHIS